MALTNDTTTLICLFHHDDQARAAMNDLQSSGIPDSAISVMGGNAGSESLESLGVPARDLKRLRDGISDGGTIVAVSAISDHVDTVEEIFGKHQATKIDEASRDTEEALPLAAAAAGETAIPIVEEELAVGKRTVDQGGVRVYRRVVEIPADATVNLREEHVVVERTAVDRPATDADLRAHQPIELTETAEEAVVSKNARVVEEVLVGKQVGEHTEHIQDTVRKTEVEVENLAPTDTVTRTKDAF